MAQATDIVFIMDNNSGPIAYEAPSVTDLGTLEDLTRGVMGGPTEASNMKT